MSKSFGGVPGDHIQFGPHPREPQTLSPQLCRTARRKQLPLAARQHRIRGSEPAYAESVGAEPGERITPCFDRVQRFDRCSRTDKSYGHSVEPGRCVVRAHLTEPRCSSRRGKRSQRCGDFRFALGDIELRRRQGISPLPGQRDGAMPSRCRVGHRRKRPTTRLGPPRCAENLGTDDLGIVSRRRSGYSHRATVRRRHSSRTGARANSDSVEH